MLESCYWIKGSVKPRLIVKHVGFEVLWFSRKENPVLPGTCGRDILAQSDEQGSKKEEKREEELNSFHSISSTVL